MHQTPNSLCPYAPARTTLWAAAPRRKRQFQPLRVRRRCSRKRMRWRTVGAWNARVGGCNVQRWQASTVEENRGLVLVRHARGSERGRCGPCATAACAHSRSARARAAGNCAVPTPVPRGAYMRGRFSAIGCDASIRIGLVVKTLITCLLTSTISNATARLVQSESRFERSKRDSGSGRYKWRVRSAWRSDPPAELQCDRPSRAQP
jgi:hypothetical protein